MGILTNKATDFLLEKKCVQPPVPLATRSESTLIAMTQKWTTQQKPLA